MAKTANRRAAGTGGRSRTATGAGGRSRTATGAGGRSRTATAKRGGVAKRVIAKKQSINKTTKAKEREEAVKVFQSMLRTLKSWNPSSKQQKENKASLQLVFMLIMVDMENGGNGGLMKITKIKSKSKANAQQKK